MNDRAELVSARRRVARKIALALASFGASALVGLFVLHRLGYEVQVPIFDVRWRTRYPLARTSQRLYVEQVKPLEPKDTRPDLYPGDPSEYPPNPITKYPMRPIVTPAFQAANPELGWLAPPHTLANLTPASENPMDKGTEWRQVANNYGFADDDFVREKPAGEFRLGFFGASVCWNGSSNDRTIAARAQQALRASGRARARCMNFGYTAWVATQELAAFAQIGCDFDLDAIVLFDGYNDLCSPWWYEVRPGYRSSFSKEREALLARVGFDTDAWREQLAQCYVGTVRRFRRLLPAGRALVVAPQPAAIHKTWTTLADYSGSDRYARHALWVYDRVFRELEEMARNDASVHVFDVRRFVRESGDVRFWDTCHVDDRGNEALGRELARRLEAIVNR